MVKMGPCKYQLLSNSNCYNAAELLTKHERTAKQSRSYKARYVKVPVRYNGTRINLFFIKLGQARDWKLLATTDLGMSFQKLMATYQIRWSIELFFRESKQYLRLGKCRSTCFDSQIADTTISLTQYIILAFHQRINNYSSFDGAFASAFEDALQDTVAMQLMEIFMQVVELLSVFAGIDVIEFTQSLIRDADAVQKIKQINPFLFEKLDFANAA